MNIAIIGRSELMYNVALRALEEGFSIQFIVTAKEAPEYKVTGEDFRKLAERIQCPFLYKPNVNAEDIRSIVDAGEIDIALSINYTGVIAQEVIDIFPMGILNAHGGDLPRYRGNACQAWAIINGEGRVGLCVHRMIGGELDSGDIISRDYFPLSIDTRVGQIYEWMETKTPELMLVALAKLKKDRNCFEERQSKEIKDALRCYPRNPSDGVIDWRQSNINILRLINASSEPFAGAFCSYKNEVMKVWRAELYDDAEVYLAVPGQVASFIQKGMVVITGAGKILLTEVEVGGKRGNPKLFFTSVRSRLT